MESALDFDLLAEYLLEDMGAGGFDFSTSPDTVSPPTINAQNTQPAPILPDPGVVTPGSHQSGNSYYVDPLSHATAQLQHPQQGGGVGAVPAPLPASGDLAGELSRVQQIMIATQQQQHLQQARNNNAMVSPPQQPLAQQLPQSQIRPLPLTQPLVPNRMAVRQPLQQQPKPAAPAAVPVTAPIFQRAPMPKNAISTMAMAQQPPNKRPRVSAAPSIAKKPPGSYSFASSVASVNGSAMRATTAARGAPLALPPASLAHQQPGIPGMGGNGHNKSQAQVDRRRERNRILARRTRLRKKFFFESLQKDVADLQRENAALKSIVRSRLKPDDARVILEQCNANERLPSAIHAKEIDGMGGGAGMDGESNLKKLDKEDFSLIQSIQNSQQCFIITDPSLHDNPIVYASDDFLTLTGYSQDEVLGRNCRFLQGTETCQDKVAQIRKAVTAGEDVSVTFVNYTSEGKPFWNSLFIAALRDADNNIVNFIGVIVKCVGPEAGDSEYGKLLK